MVDERFDIVDEHDKPLGGLITKEEAHKTGAVHRLVAVYVFDSEGRLFIQKHWSGYLDHTVGGHVSAGEDYPEAAIRETQEEIGLENAELVPVKIGLYSDEMFNFEVQKTHQCHIFAIYETTVPKGWEFVPNEEVKEISPQTLEETINQMKQNPTKFTPGFINTMAAFIEVKNLNVTFDLEKIRNKWGRNAA
jgi:isopentenyldiphosphate isomerase